MLQYYYKVPKVLNKICESVLAIKIKIDFLSVITAPLTVIFENYILLYWVKQ